MEIREFQAYRCEMESQVMDYLRNLFVKFRRDTGVSPKEVWVTMQDVSEFGRPLEHVLLGVSINCDI